MILLYLTYEELKHDLVILEYTTKINFCCTLPMRNWNDQLTNAHRGNDAELYLTYEELKLNSSYYVEYYSVTLYLTYEELKHLMNFLQFFSTAGSKLYLTYEELKQIIC